MARRDLFHRDASDHAASELQYTIRNEKRLAQPVVKRVSAEEAMHENRVFEMTSNRDTTRVLFISQNTELLNPIKQSLDGYINISDLFAEVHILILRQGIPAKNPVLRVAPNVWLYTATARYWWQSPARGFALICEQLEFADGFRPDLIIARDPFESALVAIKAQKKYDRPNQLHIIDDYSTAEFIKKERRNFWRVFIPFFTIQKFLSVRTASHAMFNRLQKKFTIPDLDVLPRYQDYTAIMQQPATLDLKEKYKSFSFFILYVGQLGYESSLYRMLDAARFALHNVRVGLIVLGEGKARKEFERRAKILGIEKQVVFETRTVDVVSYLKSANILLVGDTDTESEEIVLQGAASGIPMVMARTDRREDVFAHGESAFLCEASDIQAFTDRISDLLNDEPQRQKFIKNGQEIIRRQFHGDAREYQEAYRTSIEQAFFVESDEVVVRGEEPLRT